MPELTDPAPRVRVSYLDACREARGGLRDRLDLDSLARPEAFALYCAALTAGALEWQHTYAGGRMRMLWFVDGDEYLGEVTIRPDLTPEFGSFERDDCPPIRWVGHLGYELRPSARRQGLGRPLLAAGLAAAAEMGVDPAVLTVDVRNAVSQRVIESCGGVRLTLPHDGVIQYLASANTPPGNP